MEWRNEQGQLHRVDGPAVVEGNGFFQAWYLNGQLHRDGGPAFAYTGGLQSWYLNGERHRADGPAFVLPSGYKEWWVNGQQLTEFEHWVLTGVKEPV